jgi:hypothetical protein
MLNKFETGRELAIATKGMIDVLEEDYFDSDKFSFYKGVVTGLMICLEKEKEMIDGTEDDWMMLINNTLEECLYGTQTSSKPRNNTFNLIKREV